MIGGAELGGQGGRGTIAGQRRQDEIGGRSLIESVDLEGSLIGGEEEQLLAQDGSAERAAELVLFQVRLGLAGGS